MKMTFRWYGESDPVKLNYIRQIPGMYGIVSAVYDVPVGEVWPLENIRKLKNEIEAHGLKFEVIESVPVHEDIKLGRPTAKRLIANYAQTLKHLGQCGLKVVCYNFMPVFDWVRTDLFHKLEDGSTALFFNRKTIENITPGELVSRVTAKSNFTVAGWEPERLAELDQALQAYQGMTEERLFDHLKYFLTAIGPACKETGINMAIHPDDPPWSVFGLPRIVTGKTNLKRILDLVDEPYNGLTLCTGSLGANPENDVVDLIDAFMDRIYFGHVRNVRILDDGSFVETSHRKRDGSLDIVGVMKAYKKAGFRYYLRPDHGRHLWSEDCRPGYGLYDRALGIMYMLGIWDALD